MYYDQGNYPVQRANRALEYPDPTYRKMTREDLERLRGMLFQHPDGRQAHGLEFSEVDSITGWGSPIDVKIGSTCNGFVRIA